MIGGSFALAADNPTVVMEVVGELPELMAPSDPRAFAVSADGEHIAYQTGSGSRQQVVVDGVAGPQYTKAGMTSLQIMHLEQDPNRHERPPVFRPENLNYVFTGNGDELVYIAEQRGQQHVVVVRDGVHQQWPSLGQLHRAGVSPGGEFIYAIYQNRVGREQEWRIIVNGEVSPEGMDVTGQPNEMAFQEDGPGPAHFAVVARVKGTRDGRSFEAYRVMIDGVPGPAFQRLTTQQVPIRFFTFKGKPAVGYTTQSAGESGERFVIQFLDGSIEKSESGLLAGSVRFGADGTSVGWLEGQQPALRSYKAATSSPIQVVLNGETVHTIDGTPSESRQIPATFRISPDGTRWALTRYFQESGPAFCYVVVDGMDGPEFSSINQLAFSPDSSRFAYVALNAGRYFVVEDDVEWGPYGRCSELVFSESGQSLAWIASDDEGGAFYLNGDEIARNAGGGWSWQPWFRPGTEDFVTLIQADEGPILMVGDRRYPVGGQRFEQPTFSPDGEHFSMFGEFYPRKGQPGSRFLVDGHPLALDSESTTVSGSMWDGFSPDGSHHLAFADFLESNPRRQGGTLLVDGYQLGILYDFSGTYARAPHFLPDGRFRFVAAREGEIVRFTVSPDSIAAFGEARAEATAKGGVRQLLKVGDKEKLISFDPALIVDGDVIYGTGQGGPYGMGVVYRVNSDGTGFEVLHSFLGGGEHARLPSSLVLGQDGVLYGTPGQGSFFQQMPPIVGGLFKVSSTGGDYEVVNLYPYSNAFQSGPVLDTVGPRGALLGRGPVPDAERNAGTAVIRFDPLTGDLSTVYRMSTYVDGQAPVIQPYGPFRYGDDGYCYGFESRSVFRFKPDGSAPVVLHRFTGAPLDGDSLRDPPEFFGDWLYGLTHSGGENQMGTLYRMKRDGSDYEVVRHFGKDDKLMGLAAGKAGVWGFRYEKVLNGHRNARLPVIERFDKEGVEPRMLTQGGLSGKIWIGELEGEPTLFGVTQDELFAVSLTTSEVPELITEIVPMAPLGSAEVIDVTLGQLEK